MNFNNLHTQTHPLLIGNVWDVPSTKIAEKLQFDALGTSSSAMARLLGYEDGEDMSFSELEYMVKRIIANTNLPLSVDLEAGYSRDPKEIVNHIKRLVAIGVVGINIEDSLVKDTRVLLDADAFSELLSEVVRLLKKEQTPVFINVRTDPFLLGYSNALEETKRRIHLYEKVGVNGIFTPCIERVSDIKEIVHCTHLPINVMCMPQLPNFNSLTALGVKRISMGNFLFENMYRHFEDTTKEVISTNTFTAVF